MYVLHMKIPKLGVRKYSRYLLCYVGMKSFTIVLHIDILLVYECLKILF